MSELIVTEPPTTIAEYQPPIERPRTALTDLRQAMMNLSPDRMKIALQEYDERRNTFRSWLQDTLIEGVHFGYPPGCKKSSAKESEWKSKPSLYKAGAEFICDLMGWRPVYIADKEAWEQLGGIAGNIVIRCTIHSRSSGEIIGEGIGARKTGNKGMDENASLKMAQKNALVCAVLNGQGLSDLFTQDLENYEPTENPEPAPTPAAPTRTQRQEHKPATPPACEQCRTLWANYCAKYPVPKGDAEAIEKSRIEFGEWIESVTGRQFNVRDGKAWRAGEFDLCMEELNSLRGNNASR